MPLDILLCIITYIATSNHQPRHQVQSLLAAHEEDARGRAEMVLELPNPFKIPRNSELVTYPSHPVYLTEEGQLVASLESQIKRFSEILAAKGVFMDSMIKFIQTSVGCIPRWYYYISEMLSSIVVVIDNAYQVFEVENIIQLALMMLVYMHVASYKSCLLYNHCIYDKIVKTRYMLATDQCYRFLNITFI